VVSNASNNVLINDFLKPTAVSLAIPIASYLRSDPFINISPRRPEPEAILWQSCPNWLSDRLIRIAVVKNKSAIGQNAILQINF
jgi:hypothetical protein